MIVIFTDFGLSGPYVGQMKAVLAREAPRCTVIDLFSDAPRFNPRASAFLLAAYITEFPPGTVFLCVVDPGVGSSERAPVVVEADGRWFVGPGNGLFDVIAVRSDSVRAWEISWRPQRLSASFHGRDLFAPVAASIARGEPWLGPQIALARSPWPDELCEVIYIDHFGNAMTGVRAASVTDAPLLEANGRQVARARTFSDVEKGRALWYENANGLIEIAVNQGRADQELGLSVGMPVSIRSE